MSLEPTLGVGRAGRKGGLDGILTLPVPPPPPRNGYQKFSQELLSNGELNHLPLKERMVEIGSRWQRISQSQKEHYKKLAEEQQKQYKVHLDLWVKVRGRGTLGRGRHHAGWFVFMISLSVPAILQGEITVKDKETKVQRG